ncbi:MULTISPECIES: FtsB family cell division protein [Roseinatronobacter]|uniref:Septum formation initiator family protein n=1 Tax=Roseinatronobacter domitianus TaxID=2940293 RepID=A0ABT0LZ88_9RHOB|nr:MULTISPECIES: septum formation initiator family protein [Roseibaca]MCL1627924.1 septum formation initiator family protein [Roseibaca domitiana]
MRKPRPAIGALFFFGTALVLALYFTFAAVQGSFGLFNRVQVQAESSELVQRRDRLQVELSQLQNKTTRLSDDFLDLDLLDERARDVLGLGRPDDVIIR